MRSWAGNFRLSSDEFLSSKNKTDKPASTSDLRFDYHVFLNQLRQSQDAIMRARVSLSGIKFCNQKLRLPVYVLQSGGNANAAVATSGDCVAV